MTSTFPITPAVNIVNQEKKDKYFPVDFKPTQKLSEIDSEIDQDKKFLVF